MLNVSFIVPVYNSEKDLPRLLSSLTGQQGDYSFEILLIDDGSTDRSFEVCRRFADEDSRIRVFHQENAGPSAARNKGLDMAGGEYILFCDADDYIETDSLQQLLSLPHHDLVFFSLYDEMWDAQHLLSSSAWKVESRAYSSTAALLNDFHYLLLHNLLYSQCTKLYCREIIEANHLRFETGISMGEDISFNLEYFAYVQSAYILNACLYHYVHVTRSQSISSGYYPGYYDNVCMVMQREKQLLSRSTCSQRKTRRRCSATSSGVCPVPFKMILPAQNVICAESTVPYAQSFLLISHRRLRAAATQPDTYIKFWLFVSATGGIWPEPFCFWLYRLQSCAFQDLLVG